MDIYQLSSLYAAGERDFSSIDLVRTNLVGANLSETNLSRANLSETYLDYADLSNADLSNADLSNADLIGANLIGANLSSANLSNADLNGAKLGGANLNNADLTGANLNKINLSGANLSGAKLDGTLLGYQKVSEELRREKQQLAEQVQLLQSQLEELKKTRNQGVNAPYEWKGFWFRSRTEIKMAEALDRAGVLFYPNCKARLSSAIGREAKETDFLVFYQGKWGILEVDGEPWHPPSRVVHDHERDRLFKVHGIRVVEHYDANRCWEQSDQVVWEFIEILKQA